jgi:site-specific recombinase XerD
MSDHPTNISVAEAKEAFLEFVGRHRSGQTVKAYRTALETFSSMLSTQTINLYTFPANEITETSIVKFFARTETLAPATESLYLQVIKNFFEFLAAEQMTTIEVSRIRKIIKQRSRRTKTASSSYPEQPLKRFLSYVSEMAKTPGKVSDGPSSAMIRDKRDGALILTLADTGLRVEEVCKLKVWDLNLTERNAILHGRGGKASFVRFSTRAMDAINNYLDLRSRIETNTEHRPSASPLFARHDKGAGKKVKPMTSTTVRNIVSERVLEVLGPEFVGVITPHTFLHYFVTSILKTTGNLKIAQVLARHANIQVTQKYAHVSDHELDEGYDAVFEQKV